MRESTTERERERREPSYRATDFSSFSPRFDDDGAIMEWRGRRVYMNMHTHTQGQQHHHPLIQGAGDPNPPPLYIPLSPSVCLYVQQLSVQDIRDKGCV